MKVMEFELTAEQIIAWIRPKKEFWPDSLQAVHHGDTEKLMLGCPKGSRNGDLDLAGFTFDRRYHTLEEAQRLMHRKKGEWLEEETSALAEEQLVLAS